MRQSRLPARGELDWGNKPGLPRTIAVYAPGHKRAGERSPFGARSPGSQTEIVDCTEESATAFEALGCWYGFRVAASIREALNTNRT
jgi:hypothetical protein